MDRKPYDERTVRDIIAHLERSPHRVHHGAAKSVAENFLTDGDIYRAKKIAEEKGYPFEAVIAGLQIAKGGA